MPRCDNVYSNAVRVLGLAMIAVGLICGASQLAKVGANATPAQAAAEMPRLENAKVETRSVSEYLENTFREIAAKAGRPQWVGYAVDQISGEHGVCCGNYSDQGNCGACKLERGHDEPGGTMRTEGSIKLEAPRRLVVLLRLETNKVMKIRVASQDCTLDAGGLPFVWLTAVKPAESVAMLASYVHGADFEQHSERGLGNSALMAIALHADSSADRAFESFVKPDQSQGLRKQAAFWMGAARGKAGLSGLQGMAKGDPNPDVRAHVAFALSVSHEPGAVDEMIRMAHDDTSGHVRGQALFWLAQKAGNKAAGTITGAIENDPDTDVKKKAVFALSQLPKDEGVPKLIEVAKTSHNPEVRKQAMFWLGQSNDRRALQFFEKVLSQ
jgi:HEAT repeat protein